MNFAQVLQNLMDEKGLSNYQLAKDLDVHPTTITNWLEGKIPRKKTQLQLAGYFHVSVPFLMGEEQKTPTLPKKDEREISDDDIKFALFGDKTIDDETYESVKNFAKFAAEQKRKRQESEQ